MSGNKELSAKHQSVIFWKNQIDALRDRGLVDADALRALVELTKLENIGYDDGQIRPDCLGRWDVYCSLKGRVSKVEQLILSGLTMAEVSVLERRHFLEKTGVDPDNPAEVAEFQRIERMTSKEIKREIAHLRPFY